MGNSSVRRLSNLREGPRETDKERHVVGNKGGILIGLQVDLAVPRRQS